MDTHVNAGSKGAAPVADRKVEAPLTKRERVLALEIAVGLAAADRDMSLRGQAPAQVIVDHLNIMLAEARQLPDEPA